MTVDSVHQVADASGAPVELRPIDEVLVNVNPIWHIHVGGQVIRTTAEHPFWVVGKGWTNACELQAGDALLSHDGQISIVEDVLDTGESETVYNFRVAEHHTYFVGSRDWGFSVWAHNADICLRVVRRAGLTAPNAAITVTNSSGQNIAVWGKPQEVRLADGTLTDHHTRVLAALPDIARDAPEGSCIVLNRAWRTATDRVFSARLRPDIILVSPLANGGFRVSAWEVQSIYDEIDELLDKLEDGWNSQDPFAGDLSKIIQGGLNVLPRP